MKAFRHWERRWAEALSKQGKLRLMPISYYRQLEDTRPGVADDLDYAVRAVHAQMEGRLTERGHRSLKGVGIEIPVNVAESVSADGNSLTIFGPDMYLFCLTTEDQPGVFNANDSVTEFPNVEDFASALLQAGAGRFTGFSIGPVTYKPVEYDAADGVMAPDPFVKGLAFQHQKEVRIALISAPGVTGPIYLDSPKLIEALGPTPREWHAVDACPQPSEPPGALAQASSNDLKQAVADLCGELMQLHDRLQADESAIMNHIVSAAQVQGAMERREALSADYEKQYRETYWRRALALEQELHRRTSTWRPQRTGMRALSHGTFTGANPLPKIVLYLRELSGQI